MALYQHFSRDNHFKKQNLVISISIKNRKNKFKNTTKPVGNSSFLTAFFCAQVEVKQSFDMEYTRNWKEVKK